jgi:glycosyltransferase involved in cell wall biosynthesis
VAATGPGDVVLDLASVNPCLELGRRGCDVERKEDFVLYLGRFSREKGVHHAIDAAREAGRPVVLAGTCTTARDRAYVEAEVTPRLGPDVRCVGEADFATKVDLMSRARCLLFPIGWEEPFGMVMIEAMACGTPVVALRRGSVPEVVVDGVTGFVRDDPRELAEAVCAVERLRADACRARVREHFDVAAMAAGYEALYRRAIAQACPGGAPGVRRHRIAPDPASTAAPPWAGSRRWPPGHLPGDAPDAAARAGRRRP